MRTREIYDANYNKDLSVIIKSKKDLKEKLKKGLEDIEANRVYSLDEVIAKIDTI